MNLSRRTFVQAATMTGIALAVLPIAGCSQQSLADLIGVAGSSLSLLLGVLGEGGTALAGNLAALFSIARNAVLTWVRGTSSHGVVQALNDVLAAVAQLQVSALTKVLISLVVAAVEHVIEAIDTTAVAGSPAQGAKNTVRAASIKWSRFAKTPTDVYRLAWNEEIANHPQLSAAKL